MNYWKRQEEQRRRIYDKFGGRCAYCGKPIDIKEMQIDHLVPRWHNLTDEQCRRYGLQRGSDDESNLMPSCQPCNYYKSTLSVEDFRKRLQGLTEHCVKAFDVRLAMRYGMVEIRRWSGVFLFELYNISKDAAARELGPNE